MFVAGWKLRAIAVASLVITFDSASIVYGDDVGGNTPPVIVSLNAVQVPGKKFRITGRVADNTPASCVVTITGAANGTAQCDAGGNFDTTCDVPTLGDITAVASDGQLSSTPAGLTLGNVAPTTTIRAVRSGGQWTFSGVVTDEAPAGLTITLSGAPALNGRTATVAADGSWSITLLMFSQAQGIATAKVTDWYGLSGQASTPFGG